MEKPTGEIIVLRIIELLKSKNLQYKILEHEPTPTSEDSAKIRGTTMLQGRKAMILKGQKSGKRIMIVIQSAYKIDMKKVKMHLHEDFEFEKPEIILKDFGIEVGGIPPLGNLLGLETFFEIENIQEDLAAFNCGLKTKSIEMDINDLIIAVKPILLDLRKI